MTELPLILIVDDDVDTCRNLADILSDLGYPVETAFDGPTALGLIRDRPPRIALLDYRMPGMDGLTLCRAIRTVSAGTVAIIVTAYSGQASVEQFVDAGASMVLPKPVDVPTLLETLTRLAGEATPGGGR
jgi:CheY-like chemotaxis protein